MKSNIAVFGAGRLSDQFLPVLKNKYEICAVYDNDSTKWGEEMHGIPIEKPSNITLRRFEELLIVSVYWKEILRQLYTEYGIERALLLQPCDAQKSKNDSEIISGAEYRLRELNAVPYYRNFVCQENNAYGMTRNGRTINRANDKKNILFIAYYFPPLGSSPVQRTLKFVKYLAHLGHKITVLTVDDTATAIKDVILLKEIPKNVTVIRVPDNYQEMEFLSRSEQREVFDFICSIGNESRFLAKWIEAQDEQQEYILPDKLITWAMNVVRNVEKLVDMPKIDVLYSTVPEWSPHLVAFLLNKKYKIPWVGDYRDPWVVNRDYIDVAYPNMTEKEILWNKILEKKLISEMDAIIVAGENWKPLFENEYGIKREKITVISNGYDEEDFLSLKIREQQNKKFTLCYNGCLGYNRKPSFLLDVFSDLIRGGRIEVESIIWIFNGKIPHNIYEQEIADHDPFHITQCNGMLSHIDSLQVAVNADLMVMYGEIGNMGALSYPSKFYEYLRIGRPILCFSESGSTQEVMLKETRLGRNFRLDDKEGIKEYILCHYDQWCTGIVHKPVYDRSIKKYDRRVLSEKLEKVVMKVSS